jgi:hypothetical protein
MLALDDSELVDRHSSWPEMVKPESQDHRGGRSNARDIVGLWTLQAYVLGCHLNSHIMAVKR